jgi:AraC-like DNA-binding protein
MSKRIATSFAGKLTDPHLTASVLLLRNLLAYARSIRLDADRLCAGVSLAPALLDDSDARVPDAALQRLWAALADASGDRALGLHLAQRTELGAFGVLDYSVHFSATIGEAVERIARFYRLLSDALAVELISDRKVSRLALLVRGSHPQQQIAFFALLCARLREASGRQVQLLEVLLEQAPDARRELEEFFGCPVRFGRARCELVVASPDLELPVSAARPPLATLLDRYATDLLARLPVSIAFADHVRRAVARSIQHQPPTLELIARELHASPRTVQRRLTEAGTTLKRLVDEVRSQLALSYVESPVLSITEIAFLLGYQDVSGFRRAFKKWTGKSPSLARHSLTAS